MSKFSAGVYGLSLVLFAVLGSLAHRFPSLPGDIAITSWLQAVELAFLGPIMQAASYLGSPIGAFITVVAVVGGLWASGRKLEPVFLASLPSLGALLEWLLKMLVNRPRPTGGLIETATESGSFSFPSGHLVYAVVFFGFLFYLIPTLTKQPAAVAGIRSGLILLIVLIGASRVYLGAHWPSDTLGSLFLGGLLLAPAIVLYDNYARGRRMKLAGRNARTA